MGTAHTFPHDDNATPTTRFIRNCEAVGLFNDLSPNPFEETFRMATSSNLSHVLKDPPRKASSEETLNTPQVISYSNQSFQSCLIGTTPVIENEEDVIVLNDFLEPILSETNHIPSPPNKVNSNDSSDVEIIENPPQTNSTITKSIPENSSINLDNIMSTSPSISNFNVVTRTINTVKNPNVVYKLSGTNLPAILGGKNVVILPSRNSPKIEEANFPKIVSRPSVISQTDNNVKQKLRNLLQSNNAANQNFDLPIREECWETNRDSNSVSSVEDDKVETSRERNRMAQKRCRLKKKRYFTQLKNETESALRNNRKLGSLVNSLQAEVAHLKTLLLAHRNCSVTRAMYKADLNAIMNNELSEIVEDIEIPASDDVDDVVPPKKQITYRSHINQVNNQQVNQVNHFHVHVPSSPETGGDQLLNFAPDPNLFANKSPFTFPHQMNSYTSKFNSNKKMICDSKVVPIRSLERSAPASSRRNDASLSAQQRTSASRKPGLKIFINGNEAVDRSRNSTTSTSCFADDSQIATSSVVNLVSS